MILEYAFVRSSILAKKFPATSGNRTRAARVAGEHSTTEPTLLAYHSLGILFSYKKRN